MTKIFVIYLDDEYNFVSQDGDLTRNVWTAMVFGCVIKAVKWKKGNLPGKAYTILERLVE